jgi:phenylacetate-CoA ligase
MDFFYRIYAEATLEVLAWLRRIASFNGRIYRILHSSQLQPFLARTGRMRARTLFLKASRECPAYQLFLKDAGYKAEASWDFSLVPIMTKENYVKRYTLEERCYNGAIPRAGVVIDESSGSTGQPNNWVRSASERNDVKRILQLNYEIIFRENGKVLLNCFALGPWATGMNVSMSLVDVGILKSIGPDRAKLTNTLRLLGPRYDYLIFGYPPFIRSFVDECELDLTPYHIDFIVGGEGLSEGLRSHLLRSANSVVSSYGASDLEINIGVETPLTITLRRCCLANPALCTQLFGRNNPPMIFQYNALDYLIETNPEGELLFTINRMSGAAPKIRYNLRDSGGVYSFAEMSALLHRHGLKLASMVPETSYFPLLFVYGRNDSSVPFYGCKVFPSDIEQILSSHPVLVKAITTFQLAVNEDEHLTSHLTVHLEKTGGVGQPLPDQTALEHLFFDGLVQVNQDFREVSKLFDRGQVHVHLHENGAGPFAGRDIRIKNKYIAE